jgi:hypothetical protein
MERQGAVRLAAQKAAFWNRGGWDGRKPYTLESGRMRFAVSAEVWDVHACPNVVVRAMRSVVPGRRVPRRATL